jgi:hypothetical protein
VTAPEGLVPESSSPDQDPQSKALLLSGVGRYADPWHPFSETSAALADLLREAGYDVDIPADVDAALAGLAAADDSDLPDLLVVNVGLPRDELPSPGTPDAAAGLTRWLGTRRVLYLSAMSAPPASWTCPNGKPEWVAAG